METTLKSSTSDGLNKQWLSHIMSNKSNELRARGTRCVSLRLIMVQHAIQRSYVLHLYQILESANKFMGERLHQHLYADGSEGGVETKGSPRAGGTSGE